MNKLTSAVTVLMAAGQLLAADIAGLKIEQNWPWSDKVSVDFTLTGDDASDIMVKVEKAGIDYGTKMPAAFENVPAGHNRIALDLDEFGITGNGNAEHVRVTLTPVNGAEYMVVDMTDPDNFDIKYLAAPPTGGFFADTQYKTSKIVLKRVRAGTFTMGSPADEPGHPAVTDWNANPQAYMETQHEVQLTNDFYLALNPMTYAQMTNAYPSLAGNVKYYGSCVNPAYDISRKQIVGSAYIIKSGQVGVGWPSETACGEDSLIGQLQRRAPSDKLPPGMEFFLPTEAEWEYACRAGTTGPFNDGSAFETNAAGRCVALDSLGVYNHYKGYTPDAPAWDAASTSLFKPNAWGFYGFHGNVWEHVADVGNSDMSNLGTAKKVEPVGFDNASANRGYSLVRGGCCNLNAWRARSASRSLSVGHEKVHSRSGVRLAVVVKRVKK